MKELTLREVCEKYDVSRRAVQGYEKYNLVQPSGKTSRGYLLYDIQAQKKITKIKKYQNYGFTLKEIIWFESANKSEKLDFLLRKLNHLKNKKQKINRYINQIQEEINNNID